MEKLIAFIHNEKVYGLVAIIVAVAMYYTSDHIDRIIEMCLASLDSSKLPLTKK